MSVREEPVDVVRVTPVVRAGPSSAVRLVLAGIGLVLWFWTQSLIGGRVSPHDRVGDALHDLTSPVNAFLHDYPRWADALLIVSSALVDALGIFLLVRGIFGPSVRPLLGLTLLLSLRQLCQGLCSLPLPEGIIWRYPGLPSLLVTYGVANDLFFSGHTAITVLSAIEFVRVGGRRMRTMAALLIVFEATAVLALRAHYTLDVFSGAVTAVVVAVAAERLAPICDRALCRAELRDR